MASRTVMLNLLGNNRTGSAFRGAARDADRFRDRLDRLNKTSLSSSAAVQKLTGRTATMAAGLLAVAPAAGAATAAVVAGAGAMAAAFGAAGIAAGAFSLAVKPQFAALENMGKLDDAVTSSTAGTKEHAKAVKAYTAALNKLPPATRDTAVQMSFLKEEFKGWSDALSGDTMPVFTKGIKALRVVMPKLGKLVATTANALEDFMDQILRGVKSKGFDAWLDRVNEAAKKTFPAFLRSAVNVGKGIAGIFDAFLPHAPAMASGIEGLTAKFAAWGQSLGGSKTFTLFMDNVRANLPALTAIFGNLVTIVGNLAQAFAPMSGISLTLVQHFTAMLAALPPPVLTALATGFIAISGALRILIPLQRAFNLVLALNPIGIVVLALAGLALGLVTAYKKSETFRRVVDTAWKGASDAVSRAWNGPLGTALKDVASFLETTLIPKVTDLAETLMGVGDKSTEASGKLGLLGRAFQGVNKDGGGFERLIRVGIGGALGSLGGPLGAVVGAVVGWFWPKIKGAFLNGVAFVRDRWRGWLTGMVVTLQNWVVRIGDTFSRGMQSLKTRLFGGLPPLRLSWSSFWNWTKAFAGNVWDTTVAAVRKWLRNMKGAFDLGVRAISSAWNKLKAAAKDPIKFVISLHNNHIAPLIDKIAHFAGIDKRMPRVPALERGGTLTNPLGVRPMRTNGPMAIVGEGRQAFPEYVIPTDPRFRSRAQRLWAAAGRDLMSGGRNWLGRMGGEGMSFERGGTIPMLASGGIIGGFLDKLRGFSFPDPVAAFKGALGRIIGSVPGRGLFRDVIAGLPPWIAKSLVAWFKNKVGFGGGKGVGKGMAFAKQQAGKPYLWGGVGPGGYDCSGLWSAIVNVVKGRNPYSRLFSTHSFGSNGPEGFVRNLRAPIRVGITDAGVGHMAGNLGRTAVESSGSAGVRVGGGARGADNSLFTRTYGLKYDQGGMLQPGVTLAVNKTGRPEPVFPSMDAARAHGGKTINVNVGPVIVQDRADADMIAAQIEFKLRAAML